MPKTNTKATSPARRNTRVNHRRSAMRLQTQVTVQQRTDIRYGIGIAMYVAGSLAVLTGLAAVLAMLPAFPQPASDFQAAGVQSTATAATVRWTAPGDDGTAGLASQYDLRVSTAPISDATFASASRVPNLPPPRAAGQPESVTVGDLQPGTTYYFALKTADEVPNWSALSNLASATTAVAGCTPVWSCTPWPDCRDGRQSRTCTDTGIPPCGTTLNKPNESRLCTAPPASDVCAESWACTDWSACTNGQQTRTCRDERQCGTTVQKPTETFDCGQIGGPSVAAGEDMFVVGPARRAPPVVRVYNRALQRTASFLAFPRTMIQGVSLSVGDIDGDEDYDIVAGTGTGAAPLVRVFNWDGQRLASLQPFSARGRTGVQVAAADIDGDRQAEIIAIPQSGPLRLTAYRYDQATRRFIRLASLSGLSLSTRGGWSFAVADFNHDDRDDVAIAPPRGERGIVHLYTYDPVAKRFLETSRFAPFGTRERLGLQLAAGDVNNDGDADVIVSRRAGAPPTVRVLTVTGRRLAAFSASSSSFRGGITLAAADTNLDGGDEVLTAVSDRGKPGVFVFRYDPGRRRFFRVGALTPFGESFQSGLRLASPPPL